MDDGRRQLALDLGTLPVPPETPVGRPARRRGRKSGVGTVPQLLPLTDPPRTARHRPVGVQREAETLYHAVEVLRAVGRRVYRCGALHRVDGRLLTTADLLRLARAERRTGGER